MAANAPPEPASGNSCCLAWQGKYVAMKKRRDYCKEAIDILQKAIGVANAEKANLEKKLGDMAADRDSKGNDSVVKASLEKEISGLKSELLSLEHNLKEKSGETKILKDRASSREREICKLKDLLKKERSRADNSEEERKKVWKELNKTKALIVKDEDVKPHVPEMNKEISLVRNLLASERKNTESEREKAESEKKKADQYLCELEGLRTTARKTSSDLPTLTSNLETVKKQLEFEKQMTVKERKRADMESAKAREQINLAEDLSKKIETIRARNEELKKEAENSAELEEKIRLLEMNEKAATDWKFRADDLTRQLREAQLVTEGLKKQLHELSLSQKSPKTRSVSPHEARDLEKAKVRLLEKELKFARKCAKQSDKVAEFENFRREFQAAEQGRLKLEFGSLSYRKNLLSEYFSRGVEGTSGLAKAEDCIKLEMPQSPKNRNGEMHPDARCHLVASSGSQDQVHKFPAQLIPRPGRGVSESDSGTVTQLESPTGGSLKLQTSGVISSETSYSDGQLLASQGRKQLSVITSAEKAKDEAKIQQAKASIFQKIETRKNANLCLVAENSLKRKRMPEAVESRKQRSSDDKKKQLQTGEKRGTLQSMVVETGYKPSEEKRILVPDMQGGSSAKCITISKKRRVSSCQKKTIIENSAKAGNKAGNTHVARKTMCLSTAKGHDAATSFLEDLGDTDCMKLLEFDNREEESCYRMARESLMSPYLPQIDFLGGELVNEDKNPARARDVVGSNSVDLWDMINSSAAPSLDTQNASVTAKMPPESTTLDSHILKHLVVFSNIEDQNSIIKMFHAANNCVQRCPSVTRAQWAVPAILFSLKMEEENLLAQERVCVFLSLLLHNFSVVSSMKTGNTLNDDSWSCLDSYSKHIYGAIADIEVGGMLSGFLEELLSLLQDLLSEQRVYFSVNSSETSESDLSINGENVALSSRVALFDHLVAGSAILAAICSAVNRVGIIRETSFEILHKNIHEKTSVPLTILHVFAYISGEEMMFSGVHDISVAVLKSIVTFLEKRHFGAKLHPGKNKCPFSDGSSSLESIASNLMEILQEFTQSNTLHQSLTEFRPAHRDFQCVLARDQSVTLCDILSLVELIACYTAWDWTSANIVAPLLKLLGMPLPVNNHVAVVSLLGQLSSIGVDACGYENEGISNLREKLTAFLQCETTLKAGFAVQIATVSSILKTLQLNFTQVFQGKTTMLLPDCGGDQSLSASANLVTKWFLLLSDEQRAFTSDFLQTSCSL
ncbi:unnamed protein product [Microthlaspi erraticum]|uniref:Uncharacterized protein n=1 Tax=Microthlaspi erraticum TaxID=1685480 RepID=A0A6D2IMT8_9BRAS|nr:unnamed protein product [Microthlaspi erraticum]